MRKTTNKVCIHFSFNLINKSINYVTLILSLLSNYWPGIDICRRKTLIENLSIWQSFKWHWTHTHMHTHVIYVCMKFMNLNDIHPFFSIQFMIIEWMKYNYCIDKKKFVFSPPFFLINVFHCLFSPRVCFCVHDHHHSFNINAFWGFNIAKKKISAFNLTANSQTTFSNQP